MASTTALGGPAARAVRPAASAAELIARIAARDVTVGIVGLGYVGLPLALAFVDEGFSVLGFDLDERKVTALERGESYIEHMDPAPVARAAATGRLGATTDMGRLGEPDVVIIAVPTPLTPHRTPEMSHVRMTAEAVAACLRRGQLVVLESTTYPGTTDELMRQILERTGLACGKDFFLAFSPEREDPGNRHHTTKNIPKLIGGVDGVSGEIAKALYDKVMERTVLLSSARAAEAAKLTENVFRAVNIALVNELKVVYDRMGIDIWEVLDAASTKPFGFMRFDPGPGWGGHCIPLDPFYLSWKAREQGTDTKFIELAGEINRAMPRYVVDKLARALNERERSVHGARVLLLGLAYKRDIGDPRESPAFEVMSLLIELGALVSYHDPHVPVAPRMRSWPKLPALSSLPLDAELLRAQDAVVIVTDHRKVDYALVAEHARLVVDTRGVYRESRPNVVKA